MSHSLLADYWDVFEVMGENSGAWMYQDVYPPAAPEHGGGIRLCPDGQRHLRPAAESFTPPWTSRAWTGPGSAETWRRWRSRGNLAAYITYMAPGGEDSRHLLAALEALAGRWAA